jgi:hypothetical protein
VVWLVAVGVVGVGGVGAIGRQAATVGQGGQEPGAVTARTDPDPLQRRGQERTGGPPLRGRADLLVVEQHHHRHGVGRRRAVALDRGGEGVDGGEARQQVVDAGGGHELPPEADDPARLQRVDHGVPTEHVGGVGAGGGGHHVHEAGATLGGDGPHR